MNQPQPRTSTPLSTPPLPQQYLLLSIYPKQKAYRVQRPIIDSIPFYSTMLKNDPTMTYFRIPGRVHNDTVEILLKFLDHHLIQPYPIISYPVTGHFIESLHTYDLTLLSSIPQTNAFELALLCNYLQLTQLYEVITSYLALQFNTLTQDEFFIKIKELNGDNYCSLGSDYDNNVDIQNYIYNLDHQEHSEPNHQEALLAALFSGIFDG